MCTEVAGDTEGKTAGAELVFLQHVFDEAAKINRIGSWLSTNILRDKMGGECRALLLHCPVNWGKYGCSWLTDQTSCFFHGSPFVIQRITEKLQLFSLSIWQLFLWKWPRWVFCFWANQLIVFVANDKIWTFKKKKKNCFAHLCLLPWAWQFPDD